MPSTSTRVLCFALLCAVSGCLPRQDDSSRLDASTLLAPEDSGVDGGLVGDAGDASVPERPSKGVTVELTAVGADGGRTTLGDGGDAGTLVLEPTRILEVRLTPRPTAPRIRVFDWTEQIVESNDTGLSAPTDLAYAYRIEFLEALQPGRAYVLTVDSELGPRLFDTSGNPLGDVRCSLKVAGEPKADGGGKSGSRRKRRH